MDWPTLLASAARLLDLHDCDHAAGSSPNTPSEKRPGTGTGVWLDIGTNLLKFLYEKDLESNEAWISIEEVTEDLMIRHNLSKEDILFVANFLATPTKLVSIKEESEKDILERKITKQETALIEWPRNTNSRNRCRLTSTGMRSVQLSHAAEKWLYAGDDASKLSKAVEYGAYTDIPELADNLIIQIRNFSKEITVLLERRDLDELLSQFTVRRDDYLSIINTVQECVTSAKELFLTTKTQKHFENWLTSQRNENFSPYLVLQSFVDVMQSIERLNRKFQSLISNLASKKREVIGLIRFDEAAVGLAFEPCSQEVIELCMEALGPQTTEIVTPMYSDFIGILSHQQEEKSQVSVVFDDVVVDAIPSPIEQFLNTYQAEILEELKKGPISLSSAISKGWLEIGDINLLPQLVGVYASPEWLEESEGDLAVSILPKKLDVQMPDGYALEGDELVLHWLSHPENT